jgi:hypothetical protein
LLSNRSARVSPHRFVSLVSVALPLDVTQSACSVTPL